MIAVDPHVHYYPAFPLGAFLAAACGNLDRAAMGRADQRVIVLQELRGSAWFDRLAEGEVPGAEGWRVELSRDCLHCVDERGRTLTILPGRQLVSSEGLEVCVLGARPAISEGLAASEYIAELRSQGLLMLPWGVGKWLGRRGRVVDALLENCGPGSFCLGDNAGRPWFWRYCPQFERARRLGVPVLPGSDPLPLPRHVYRPGTAGVLLDVVASDSVSTAVINGMRSLQPSSGFGTLVGAGAFVRDQIELRLNRGA